MPRRLNDRKKITQSFHQFSFKGIGMSITNEEGLKIILPRLGKDELWDNIHKDYAGKNRLRWKYLAMLSLQVNGGWSLDEIGLAFGHPKGHIVRCLNRIKKELCERFQQSAEYPDTQQPETNPEYRNPKWETKPEEHSSNKDLSAWEGKAPAEPRRKI